MLAQLHSLAHAFPKSNIKLFLLPDRSDAFDIPKSIKIKTFQLFSRSLPKTSFFKFFKMLEFSFLVMLSMYKFKPDIIHVHDENSLIGPLLYKQLNSRVKLIYDDHELINCPPKSLVEKLMYLIERRAYKISDMVIVANDSRARIGKFIYDIKTDLQVIPNYLFDFDSKEALSNSTKLCIVQIEELHSKGYKVLLHQGALLKGRDLSLIHKTLTKLSDNWAMFFIGCSEADYKTEIGNHHKSHFGGFIDYDDLSKVWAVCDAVMICYTNESINNKYCAPNRLYLALSNKLPVIINDNFELNRLNREYGFGVNVEECVVLIDDELFTDIRINYTSRSFIYNIKNHPVLDVYNKISNG